MRALYRKVWHGEVRDERYDRMRFVEGINGSTIASVAMDGARCVGFFMLWPMTLTDGSRAVAAGLMSFLRRGFSDETMVDALCAAATADDDHSTRSAAASSLGFVDKHADKAAAALAMAFKDRYGVVRRSAAQGLLQLGKHALPAVNALIAALESDAYPKVQWYAAGALGAIGPGAAAATNVEAAAPGGP